MLPKEARWGAERGLLHWSGDAQEADRKYYDPFASRTGAPMNAAFGPVMISIALWLGFMIFWCIICFVQSRSDAASGKAYPDQSNP